MTPALVSGRIADAATAMAPFTSFFTESDWSRRRSEPGICDFVFGNPHEMPLPQFVQALQQSLQPQDKNWFAYKMSEPESTAVVAATLRERYGLPFAPEDILMTNGGFAAIGVALNALVNPGDEVMFVSPPWFFYEALIAMAGGRPVRVGIDPTTFDLDLAAIASAITERTRAIIVNSPHNPTGKIYGSETLTALADILTAASQRYGRPIMLLSDEAYSRIVFDGRQFMSATQFYEHTLLLYTYGKTLLTPGQRIGYIALPPTMPERAELREALFAAQVMTGYAFPNALLQHALPELERLHIDVAHLQHKRDLVVRELRAIGYELHVPEGTFYLMVRAPIDDDLQFMKILAHHAVFCLPGTVVEMPGYFRISLTANDEMIERALPAFAAAFAEAHQPA